MTPADLSRLESLAREATPGPWVADDTNEQLFGVMKDGVLHYLGSADPGLFSTSPTTAEQEVANAAYIAAANPAAVLALIERVRELEGRLEAIRDECDGKEDADDGIPNTAMRCMMIANGEDRP